MTRNLLDQIVASSSDRFRERWNIAPQWVVAAPGRVNLIGEHIDYNDGFVLPMALDRYCVITAAECSAEMATIYSVATAEEAVISLETPTRHPSPGHWSNYVAGVLACCIERGMRPRGFQAIVESAVPFGGGLSSSASLEVAMATLVEAMTQITIPPVEKALLCQKAEHEFAGVPCGIMDQFASVMGHTNHLMLIDCRSQLVEHIPFADSSVTVLIINTNVRHELSGGEYAERRGQCESAARKLGIKSLRDTSLVELEAKRRQLDSIEFRRARHAISEIARTVEAAAAVKSGDWPRVGRLMFASHDSLRDDYEVSCRELDLLVELARGSGEDAGVIGSRMTGGGFGGCTVSLVRTEDVDNVAQQLAQAYRAETGIEPSLLTSRPSRGAHVIQSA